MSGYTAYLELPSGERIELPATMPDITEADSPLWDGKFELPEAVKEMLKWADEAAKEWDSDPYFLEGWLKPRRRINFNPPEHWEAVQDKRCARISGPLRKRGTERGGHCSGLLLLA